MKVSELKASLNASVFFRGLNARQVVGFTVATVAKKHYNTDTETIIYEEKTFTIIGAVTSRNYAVSMLDNCYNKNAAYCMAEKFVFIVGDIILFCVAQDLPEDPQDNDIIDAVAKYEADSLGVPSALLDAAKALAEKTICALAQGTADPKLDDCLNDIFALTVYKNWGVANNHNPIIKAWKAKNCPRDSAYHDTHWERFGNSGVVKDFLYKYAQDAFDAERAVRIARIEADLNEYLQETGFLKAQELINSPEPLELPQAECADADKFVTNLGSYPFLNGNIGYQWGSYEYHYSNGKPNPLLCKGEIIAQDLESAQDAYESAQAHFSKWEAAQMRAGSQPKPQAPIYTPEPIAQESAPEPQAEPQAEPETVAPTIEDFPQTSQAWGIDFICNMGTPSYNRGEYAYVWGAYHYTENLAGGCIRFVEPQTAETILIIAEGIQSAAGAYEIARAHWLSRVALTKPQAVCADNYELFPPESITDFEQYKREPFVGDTGEFATYVFKCGLGASYTLNLPLSNQDTEEATKDNLTALLTYPNGLSTRLPFSPRSTVSDYYRTIYHDWTHGAKAEFLGRIQVCGEALTDTQEYREELLAPECFGSGEGANKKLLDYLQYLQDLPGGILRIGSKEFRVFATPAAPNKSATYSLQDLETRLFPYKVVSSAPKAAFDFYEALYQIYLKYTDKKSAQIF